MLVLGNPGAKKWPHLTPEQRLHLWQERPILKSSDNQKVWALLTAEQRETYWNQAPKVWQNLTPQEQLTIVESVRKHTLFQGLSGEEIRRTVAKIDQLPPKEMQALSNASIEAMKEAAIEVLAEESRQLAAQAAKAKAAEAEHPVGR
ncbi:hypothetical protein J3458_013172 [Metarhizium acridum]|uniref:uncharacterized protein n=1 Tax=Metarhizium acridum TaxID=92637 RepID=UPI001C6BDF98|nr:hypothetical protein J3458_013172 [Metarhizium acridum]